MPAESRLIRQEWEAPSERLKRKGKKAEQRAKVPIRRGFDFRDGPRGTIASGRDQGVNDVPVGSLYAMVFRLPLRAGFADNDL